ncbi:hypothetical protein GBK02_09065 [Dechloromonas sp. TW-R-39-2]|uniref:hypothetical protein n=1 Tax=Dechloromonas sp. TW-R-39-2 TaxID=2654218 RepID=UPI00193E14F3|nr:hypothetical protein [Dechloromonas sp. TW-R-39-2]QRM19540.1 hypothetical protein GBK02_09065 [Dechloromonas sp. TW-R-39-2]
MKSVIENTLRNALTAVSQRTRYLMALYQLRSLEISLQGKCESLADVADSKTRASMANSIKQLSLAVVESRNQVRQLRRATAKQNRWSAA